MSYSFTIADFPAPTRNPGFEAHMYLVNGDTSTTGEQMNGATDWNSPDIFILRIENQAAGNVRAQIQWKTNYPGANATNVPVSLTTSTAVGTWTVTFTDSTSGTLTGPGITGTNFTLPADAVLANFSPASSFVQFGMFKNDGANDGHNNGVHGTFNKAQFTGTLAPFDDDFSGATLTNKYAWRRTSASAVQHIPAGTAWAMGWTLPADGFAPEIAPAVTGTWNPLPFTATYQSAGQIFGLVPQTAVPGGNSAYFRMVKRPFTKLQVLMPGETATPNTATGKTGAPIAQTAGMPFNVTVNAVDAFWNVVSASDTVAITSSDPAATLPADAALVGGTKTFSVTLNGVGSFTVTATDVTDAAKTANTGSSTTVQ